jgi:hypothetical protein
MIADPEATKKRWSVNREKMLREKEDCAVVFERMLVGG